MRKWAMAMGILLLAAGLCGAEEPVSKTENGTAPAVETEKAPATEAPAEKAAPAAPKADMDKVSYVIGLTIGREMKTQGIELRTEAFMKGLNDSLSGAKPSLTDAEIAADHGKLPGRAGRKERGGNEEAGRGEQEEGRGLSCRKQEQGGCPDPAERPSVQGHEGRRRQEADRLRLGDGQL